MTAEKHPWQRAWEKNKFSITTDQPSVLVKDHESNLSTGDRILDAGCGNGRNTVYLASKGFEVDAFDVMSADWVNNLSGRIKKCVNFQQSNISEYPFPENKYNAVLATRVIQYLNKQELNYFLSKIVFSLDKDGFLLLSFNNKGGVFKQADIKVPKYKYSINHIKDELTNFFRVIDISEGARKNMHVNYTGKIRSYDIYAAELIDPKTY